MTQGWPSRKLLLGRSQFGESALIPTVTGQWNFASGCQIPLIYPKLPSLWPRSCSTFLHEKLSCSIFYGFFSGSCSNGGSPYLYTYVLSEGPLTFPCAITNSQCPDYYPVCATSAVYRDKTVNNVCCSRTPITGPARTIDWSVSLFLRKLKIGFVLRYVPQRGTIYVRESSDANKVWCEPKRLPKGLSKLQVGHLQWKHLQDVLPSRLAIEWCREFFFAFLMLIIQHHENITYYYNVMLIACGNLRVFKAVEAGFVQNS